MLNQKERAEQRIIDNENDYEDMDDIIAKHFDSDDSSVDITDWEKYVKQDPRFMRPAEVAVLCGDSTKAREMLGWYPRTSFEQMISKMVQNDLELLK